MTMDASASQAWAGAAMFAAIAFALAIYHTALAWFAHRERMAKIQNGIDPGKVDGGQGSSTEFRERK
jgi:hypothetical protein